ncbi:MAG: hypothetical protein ACRD1A_14475 [Terriglobales bacterium]
MNAVLVDTSAVLALRQSADREPARAVGILERVRLSGAEMVLTS